MYGRGVCSAPSSDCRLGTRDAKVRVATETSSFHCSASFSGYSGRILAGMVSLQLTSILRIRMQRELKSRRLHSRKASFIPDYQ